MAHSGDSTTCINISTQAHIEGPSEYLSAISTSLLSLLVAVLAAPARVERAACVAFRREAAREGLDADDVEYLLMHCTLTDSRDDRDEAA